MKDLAKLKKQYEKLGEEIKRLEGGGLWKPSMFDEYYHLFNDGKIERDGWEGFQHERDAFAMGNVFRTRKEAELEKKRRIVTQKLKELAGGFKPDWKDIKQVKWNLYYEHEVEKWKLNSQRFCSVPGVVYFASEGDLSHAREVLGSELDVLRG